MARNTRFGKIGVKIPADWGPADEAEVVQAKADGRSAYTDGESYVADPSIYSTPQERAAYRDGWIAAYEADHTR
ncbi:MAG: hypothetical protein S0880_10405 [Actinomycetota bacterium]|nr:hypothetical protein [Actinomycetota bacterium]